MRLTDALCHDVTKSARARRTYWGFVTYCVTSEAHVAHNALWMMAWHGTVIASTIVRVGPIARRDNGTVGAYAPPSTRAAKDGANRLGRC